MEKRFIAWLALSAVIVVLYSSLFAPRPVPPVVADPQAADQPGEPDAPPPAEADAGAPDPNQAARDTDDEPDGIPGQPDPELAGAEEIADEIDVPRQLVAIGSLEPFGPYRFAATLSNEGAGVVRVEMSSPRFSDLHDRRGYLGHLGWTPAPAGGFTIEVVPRGTPAFQAGFEPGDVVTQIGEQPVNSREELDGAFADTEPGDRIMVHVRRDGVTRPPVEVVLRRRPLEVIRPERENDALRNFEVDDPTASPQSLLLTLAQVGDLELQPEELELAGVALRMGRWEVVEATINTAVFRKRVGKFGLEFTKSYRIAEVPTDERDNPNYPAYHLELEVGVKNLAQKSTKFAYVLEGPNGLPIEGWWYANRISRSWGGGIRDALVRYNEQPVEAFAAKAIGEDEVGTLSTAPLIYAGIDSQYFASVAIPRKQALSDIWIKRVEVVHVGPPPGPRDDLMLTNSSFRLVHQPVDLAPGNELRESYTLFCGPKRPDLLSEYKIGSEGQYSLSDFEYYGWNIWAVFAKTMTGILHVFYSWIGNYGIAIVMLTILVRGCIFPLSLKQTKSMAKMQELKPELEKIKEKYKNDLEKQARAQRELWSKHGVNPMGGCLLMFVQLPIFIGLYRALMIDIELRQAPLFSESIRWCSNLAAPDMLFDWARYLAELPRRRPGDFRPRTLLQPAAVIHGRTVSGAAEDVHAGTHRRTDRAHPEDDEVHDDLHRPAVL